MCFFMAGLLAWIQTIIFLPISLETVAINDFHPYSGGNAVGLYQFPFSTFIKKVTIKHLDLFIFYSISLIVRIVCIYSFVFIISPFSMKNIRLPNFSASSRLCVTNMTGIRHSW